MAPHETEGGARGALSNVALLEHVNLSNVADLSSRDAPIYQFYMRALGCAYDPRRSAKIWANFGRTQLHFSAKTEAVFAGTVVLYVRDLDRVEAEVRDLQQALALAAEDVDVAARVTFVRSNRGGFTTATYPRSHWQTLPDLDGVDHLKATDPYGNKLVCLVTPSGYWRETKELGELLVGDDDHEINNTPDGLPFVVCPIRVGTARGISRFWEHYLGATTRVTSHQFDGVALETAHVLCGQLQAIVFQETTAAVDDTQYRGHHLCIYIDTFDKCCARAQQDSSSYSGKWTVVDDEHQFRIYAMVDPDNRRELLPLELEIRSVEHFRFLIHRDGIAAEQNAINTGRRQQLC